MVSAATVEMYNLCWVGESKIDWLPHYQVGMRCIERVLEGIQQVAASHLSDVNKLHRLWIHEICRVWADRLTSDDHRRCFLNHVNCVSLSSFKQNIDQYLFASTVGKADYSILPKIYFSALQNLNSNEAAYDEVKILIECLSIGLFYGLPLNS